MSDRPVAAKVTMGIAMLVIALSALSWPDAGLFRSSVGVIFLAFAGAFFVMAYRAKQATD